MKKVLIKIYENSLIIKEKIRLSNEYKNILNTNVISCNELVFSDDYIKNNKKIMANFFEELTKDSQINTIIFESNLLLSEFLDIFKNNKLVINLILKEESPLTFSICEKIMQSNIKNVNCYTLQPFMIEYLDKYGIMVESRNEILFLSNFMLENNLNQFSNLFYKMNIQMELPLSQQDEEDFNAFCKINKYLKCINVNLVNKNDLEFIIKTLKLYNKKNIKILIHENINNEETANYLKEFNKKKSKKYKIYFRLKYSNEYIKENIFKQTNYSILKFCSYLILLIVIASFSFVFYDNYSSMKRVNTIKENIIKVIEINDSEKIIADLNANKDEEDKLVVNEDIASLINVNPETVGWLKVNNTNIDYPVVKTINNNYYLSHNFYLEEDNNGWVFMDYRNETEDLSENIIIYAHNRYSNGVMFGTLQNAFRYDWYTNPENQIISLKTLYENLEYQIFSIYKIRVTTDYIKTLFVNNQEKLKFYNMLKNRSIYNFNIELTDKDKILTLSTCADEENRYVIHAVLKNET